MGLLENFRFKKQTTETEVIKNVVKSVDQVNTFNLSLETSLPIVKEIGNKDWVDYLTDQNEQYPDYLDKLYSSSPTHSAIVDTKSLIVAGNGYTIDDSKLNEIQKTSLNQLLSYIDGKHSIEDLLTDISKDFELYGSIYLEIIWSLDFSRPIKIKRISQKNIRSGKMDENGDVKSFYYSRNWSDRREEIKEIPSFDITNKEDYRQLLFIPVQMVSNDYYGEPQYLPSINWIELESQTGLYYKSLLNNGFNPSVVIKFFRKPASVEERSEIINNLKSSFGGVKQAGKAVVMFSDGKELAPEISPIEVSNVDKQFVVIADSIVTKILTGHRITTPELLGISIPGKLGTADFATQVDAFQQFVIRPNQKVIEQLINKLLRLNGFDVNFQIKPYVLNENKNTQIIK